MHDGVLEDVLPRDRDGEPVSRFFWCPKASPREREGNSHPSVKPVALTEHLARLLLPPADVPRRLLVPFCGSGSELVGAYRAGWRDAVGIDISEDYVRIAEERLAREVM